jgi:formamidopyrimidine-DNA glycosylase
MPELPEVETLVRQLRPLLLDRRILGAKLSHDDILDGVTPRGLTRGLIGATITGLQRRAKHALTMTRCSCTVTFDASARCGG